MDKTVIEKYLNQQKKKAVEKFDFGKSTISYTKKIKQTREVRKITGNEEVVRAYILTKLINELGYKPENIEIEKEYDIVHFSSSTTSAFYKANIPTVVSTNCLFSRQMSDFLKYLPPYYKIFFNEMSFNLFKKLEEKSFKNNYPNTTCKITPTGIDAFETYVKALKSYLNP